MPTSPDGPPPPPPPSELQLRVLDLIADAGAAGLSWPELVRLTGADLIALAIVISNLVHAGELTVQGMGTREAPRRYWLACSGSEPLVQLRAHA